jgi:hypothetical protein
MKLMSGKSREETGYKVVVNINFTIHKDILRSDVLIR